MKKQISDTLILAIGFLAVATIFTIIGIENWDRKNYALQSVEIAHNSGYVEGYDRGYQEGWKVGYDKGYSDKPPVYIDREVIKLVPQIEYRYYPVSSSNITAEEVLAILAEGKKAHQYYIDNPGDQNYWTGDTPFNQIQVSNYTGVENFVMWAANRIDRLGRVETWLEYMATLPPPIRPPK